MSFIELVVKQKFSSEYFYALEKGDQILRSTYNSLPRQEAEE